MSVRTFDSPLRMFVSSHSRAKVEHLVELDAYDGVGLCHCESFSFRIDPLLKQGQREPKEALRCRHIKEARDFVLDKIIATIAQQQKEKEKVPPKKQGHGVTKL